MSKIDEKKTTKEITAPSINTQYQKTPVTVSKVIDVILEPEKTVQVADPEHDPMSGEQPTFHDIVIPAVWGKATTKVPLITGSGETTKVIKYSDLDKLVSDAELEDKVDLMDGVSVESVKKEIDTKDVKKYGRWGLGCPHNCGRFWEFKPNDKLDKWIPSDDAAHTGKQPKILETVIVPIMKYDEETHKTVDTSEKHTLYIIEYPDGRTETSQTPPEPNRGYLKWNEGSFVCDRCGGVVTLK